MPRPCHSLHGLTPLNGGCHWCDLYHTDAGYRAHWGGEVAVCRHLGGATGETVDCPTCPARTVRLKVLACTLHTRCTVGRKVDDLACCDGCSDRQPAGT